MGKGNNTFSIIGLVCSLLFFIPFAPVVGIILGIVGLAKGESRGLAIAAIVIGALFVLMSLLFIGSILLFASKLGSFA